MTFEYTPGSLVELRDRPWVVLPSDDEDLILLRPLGGSDDEITGIYRPLLHLEGNPKSYRFEIPKLEDLSSLDDARLLYQASRLNFRQAAGPFRCLAKLSFRPRSYQLTPLVMALNQSEALRLFIADDVGVGKTLEALLVAYELYERGEIKRFSIVCLPHLCEQWQSELRDKFGLDAVVVRSSTVASLERQVRSHENIFEAFPIQVISIDYIKADNRRQTFIQHAPDLLIVDEAHSCALPHGSTYKGQQKRHQLLVDLLEQKKQIGLILLSATPHSGRTEEFQSLLKLLDDKFKAWNSETATEAQRKELAKHFIQRKRIDVVEQMLKGFDGASEQQTAFPTRNSKDLDYNLSPQYLAFFEEVLDYLRESILEKQAKETRKSHLYWEAIGLLRGIMSSPKAGIKMLENKGQKLQSEEEDYAEDASESLRESVLDLGLSQEDELPLLQGDLIQKYSELAQSLEALKAEDLKLKKLLDELKILLKQGRNPIVFCRYIATAKYLEEACKEAFKKEAKAGLHVLAITSELADEDRRLKIEEMGESAQRLLLSTDCLSEGINLQEHFDALIHYDLPWNPNRIEQREGRIDRFGQSSENIEIRLMMGMNNPIDTILFKVLLEKTQQIKKTLGISIPISEKDETLTELLASGLGLLGNKKSLPVMRSTQQGLFDNEALQGKLEKEHARLEEAANRERTSRHRFAQHAYKVSEFEKDLKEVDQAIGDPEAVKAFFVAKFGQALREIKGQGSSYEIDRLRFKQYSERCAELLSPAKRLQYSFLSPTPKNMHYLGRNNPLIAQAAQEVLQKSLMQGGLGSGRVAVLRSPDVTARTVLLQLRVRNVIRPQQAGRKDVVAEELYLLGYCGIIEEKAFMSDEEAKSLFLHARPSSQNLSLEAQQAQLEIELEWLQDEDRYQSLTEDKALARAEALVKAHTRFKHAAGKGRSYEPIRPVLPMDVLGIYVLLPEMH